MKLREFLELIFGETPPELAGDQDISLDQIGRLTVAALRLADPDISLDPIGRLTVAALREERSAAQQSARQSQQAPRLAMAFDTMPRLSEREGAIAANEVYQSFYNRYFRGDLPSWANKEFERILRELAGNLEKLTSEIAAGRNGRPDGPLQACLKRIKAAAQMGDWPAKGVTDEQQAKMWNFELRTYQRAKRVYLMGSGGMDDG
jgi:hypothetical protein